MKAYLYDHDCKAMSFDICMYLTGFYISDAQIIDGSALPFVMRYGLEHGKPADTLLQEWLRYRMFPDYRPDLDAVMCEKYGIPQRNVGRMRGTQHTAAFLNGWTSRFDHFGVYPEKTESLCYALQDRRFWTLYFAHPKQKREKQEEEDMTIRSGLPAFWEKSEECFWLRQTCYQWEMETYSQYAEQMRSIGMRVECDGNQIVTNFSFLKCVQDTIWLSDLIPLFTTGIPVKEQILNFFLEPQIRQIASELLQYEQYCKGQGDHVSLTQLGISICKDGLHPVILL